MRTVFNKFMDREKQKVFEAKSRKQQEKDEAKWNKNHPEDPYVKPGTDDLVNNSN